MCPYTATDVSSHYLSLVARANLKEALYCKMCVLMLLHILLYMCAHTATHVSSSKRHFTATYVCSYYYIYYYICVLILRHMCPDNPTCVSTYSYMCVRILLHMSPTALADGGLVMSVEVSFMLFRAVLCCCVGIIQVGVCVCVCVCVCCVYGVVCCVCVVCMIWLVWRV
jgi:hypothetical protein